MIKAESISDIIYFRYMGKWCEERKVRELEKQVEAMECLLQQRITRWQ